MMLFNERERDYLGWATYGESTFAYLDRSAKHSCARIRDLLEDWFTRYPASQQEGFCPHFRDTNSQANHQSALFELVLHELLLRLGCKVDIHPKVSKATQKTPDFLVSPPTGEPFYLEAVLVSELSREAAAAESRCNDFYNALNKLNSPDFFIGIKALNWAPETPVPAKKLRHDVRLWLDTLDHAKLSALVEAGESDAVPTLSFTHDGQQIVLKARPKGPNNRGRSDVRPISDFPVKGGFVDLDSAVQDAVVGKARRYGQLDRPYLIAVNALGMFFNRDGIEGALYGKAHWLDTRKVLARATADRYHGVWTSNSGPRYTRVSAVLAAIRLNPWALASANICLYHNPWAQRPYGGELSRLPQAVLQAQGVTYAKGVQLAEVFGLPVDWPGDD